MQVMQLLARLHNANISTGKLEDIIGCDPVLSYKTLKLINSAYHRTAARIESLGRAITYLGTDQIRALASLLALATLSDKPLALRARPSCAPGPVNCSAPASRARPGPPSFRRACYQPWMLTSTNRSTSP